MHRQSRASDTNALPTRIAAIDIFRNAFPTISAAIPTLLTLAACLALLLHGPIAQLPHYHDFADRINLLGIPHAADVLSNLAFAAVGIWGWFGLRTTSARAALGPGWHGYRLFLAALVLTALGSGFYHWAPDNARLVLDRLPIALACAGLLAAVRADTRPRIVTARRDVFWLTLAAIASVAWWYATDLRGAGDLRPYLLLQMLPLALIPLWQAIYRASRSDRIAFGIAIVLYLAAKVAELHDHQLLAAWHWISGHTLKHLLAAAAAVLVAQLVRRARMVPAVAGQVGA